VQLGDLLISAKLVTKQDVDKAVDYQRDFGGRLGDNLVAIGAIKREVLEGFIGSIPVEPGSIQDTGVNETELLNLLIKQIYTTRIETPRQFAAAIKLPAHIVDELVRMAVGRSLLVALGISANMMRYELSEQGRRWAQEALKGSLYAGPAPVPLDDFCARVKMQKVTNDLVTFESIRAAMGEYNVTDAFIRKIGPALNSGRAMLLYGPPGNGKTTVALSFASVFDSIIYVPYAVMIEGQIMRVFDPSFHSPLKDEDESQESVFTGLRAERYDARWVPVRRPFVVTGGELTLEMLDLSYDHATGFYEAPLHIKALGGCFVIDDFGRQIVTPANLLNRWIVPMESRVDYLKLHTGKSFAIPFEALVIFSTNINPEDLMDGAFLRRLPYKIEVGAPNRQTYRSIFEKICAKYGIAFTDQHFDAIVHKITHEKGMELAAFHARFIIDQVLAIARFMGMPPALDGATIDYALDNLAIKGQSSLAVKV
jgi:hypothetical protein